MKSGSFTFLGHAIFTPDLNSFCIPAPVQASKDKCRTSVENHLPDDHLLRYTVSDYLSTTNGFLVGSHNACTATLFLSHGRAILKSSYTSNEDSSSNKEENPGRVYATLTNRDNTRDSLYLEEQCVYNSMAFNFLSEYSEKWHQLCPTKDANTSFRLIYEIEKQPSLSQKKATGLLEQIKNNILKQLPPSPYVLSGTILDNLFEHTDPHHVQAQDIGTGHSGNDEPTSKSTGFRESLSSLIARPSSTNWREHKRNPSSRLSTQVETYLNDIFNQPSQEEEKTEEGKEGTIEAIQASALYFQNILKNLVFIKLQESHIDNATNHHYLYHHTLAFMAHAIDQYLEEQNNSNKEEREFNADKAGILGHPDQQELFFRDLETLLASAKDSNRTNFLEKNFQNWNIALDSIRNLTALPEDTPQEINISLLMNKIKAALTYNSAQTFNSIISSIILELTADFCSECERLDIRLVSAKPVSQTIDAGPKLLVHQQELLQEIDASYFLYRFYLAYIKKQIDALCDKPANSPKKQKKQKANTTKINILHSRENQVCLLNDLTDFLSRPNHEFDQTIISNAIRAGWISGIKSMLDSPNSFDAALVKQVIERLEQNYTQAHTDFMAMCDSELPEYRKKLLFNALKTELLGFIHDWKNTVTIYIQNLPEQTTTNKQDSIDAFFARYENLLTTENKPKVENNIAELKSFISEKLRKINPSKKKLARKLLDQFDLEESIELQLLNNLELLQNLLDKFGKTNMAVAYLTPAHNESISDKTQNLWQQILLTSQSMQADIYDRLAVATQLITMQPSHLPELSRENYLHIRAIQTIEDLQNSLTKKNGLTLDSADQQIIKLKNELDTPTNKDFIKHIPTLLVALQRKYATKPTPLEKKFSIAFASLYIKHQASTHKTQSPYLTAFENYALASVTGDPFDCLNYASITHLKLVIGQEASTIGYLCVLYQFIYALPDHSQTSSPPHPSEIFNVFSSNQCSIFSENNTFPPLFRRLLTSEEHQQKFKQFNSDLKNSYTKFKESFLEEEGASTITKKDIRLQLSAIENYINNIAEFNSNELTDIMTAFVYLQLLAYTPFVAQDEQIDQVATAALSALKKLQTGYSSSDAALSKAYQQLYHDLKYYYSNLIRISPEKKNSQIAITKELEQRTERSTSTTELVEEHDIAAQIAPFANWAKEQLNDLTGDAKNSKPIIYVVLMYLLRQTLAPLYTEKYCSSKLDDITDLMKVFAKLCFMHNPPLNKEGHQINQINRSKARSRRVSNFDQTTLDDQYGKTLDTAFIDTINLLSTVDMSAAIRYLHTLPDYVELSDHDKTTLNYSTAFSDIAEVTLANIHLIPNDGNSSNQITKAINSAQNSLLFFLILFEAMLTPTDSRTETVVLHKSNIEAALKVFDKPEEVMQEPNTEGGEEESKESPKENIKRKKGKNVAALHKLVTKGHSEHGEKPGYFYSFIQQKNSPNSSKSSEVIAAREFIRNAKHISKVFVKYLEQLLSYFPKNGATTSSDCKIELFSVNDPRNQLTGSMLTVLYSAYHKINPVIAEKLLAPKLMEQHHIEATPYIAEMVTRIPRKNFIKQPTSNLVGTIDNFFDGTDHENNLLLNKHAAIFHYQEENQVYMYINGSDAELSIEEIFDWIHNGLRYFARNTELTTPQPTKITVAVEKIETIDGRLVHKTEVKCFIQSNEIKQNDVAEQAPQCAPDFLTACNHTIKIYKSARHAKSADTLDYLEESNSTKKPLSAYTAERFAAAEKICSTYLITKKDQAFSAYELLRFNLVSETGLMHRCYNALFETVELLIKKQQPEANYPEHKNPREFLLRCITLAYITKLANLEPKLRPFGRENYYTDASHFVHPPAFRAIEAADEHICSLLFYCYVAHAFFNELQSLNDSDSKLLVFKLNLIRMINQPTEILENVHEWARNFFDLDDTCYAEYLPKETQTRLRDTKNIIGRVFQHYAAPEKEKKTLEVLSFFFFPSRLDRATSALTDDKLYQPVATNSANKETPVENFSAPVVDLTC